MKLKKIKNYIAKEKNPYILKVGDMLVKIEYTESDKTFYECMVNILKQKKKMD